MKCPHCETGTAWVMGSREKNGAVRRRRVCKTCGYRFTTTEIPVERAKQIMTAAADIFNNIKTM